jgi:hypothetical protein
MSAVLLLLTMIIIIAHSVRIIIIITMDCDETPMDDTPGQSVLEKDHFRRGCCNLGPAAQESSSEFTTPSAGILSFFIKQGFTRHC